MSSLREQDRALRARLDPTGAVKYRSPLWCEIHNSNERYVRGGRCVQCAKEAVKQRNAEIARRQEPTVTKVVREQELPVAEVMQKQEPAVTAKPKRPKKATATKVKDFGPEIAEARREKISQNIYDFVRTESPHAIGFLAERIVREVFTLRPRKDQTHDLFDEKRNFRVEVKSARAQGRNANRVFTADNVLEYAAIGDARFLPEYADFVHAKNTRGLRFSHLSKDKFDALYVVVFFKFDAVICEVGKSDGKFFYWAKVSKNDYALVVNNKCVNGFFDSHTVARVTYEEIAALLG